MDTPPRNSFKSFKFILLCNLLLNVLTIILIGGMIIYLVPKIQEANDRIDDSSGMITDAINLLKKAKQIPEVDWIFFTNQTEQTKFIDWIKYLINFET